MSKCSANVKTIYFLEYSQQWRKTKLVPRSFTTNAEWNGLNLQWTVSFHSDWDQRRSSLRSRASFHKHMRDFKQHDISVTTVYFLIWFIWQKNYTFWPHTRDPCWTGLARPGHHYFWCIVSHILEKIWLCSFTKVRNRHLIFRVKFWTRYLFKLLTYSVF